MWAKKEYLNHIWWENAAVIDLLGYEVIKESQTKQFIKKVASSLHIKKMISKVYNKLKTDQAYENAIPNEKLLKKVKWLDLRWNSIPEDTCPNPIIKHYPNKSKEFRLKNMSEDLINGE